MYDTYKINKNVSEKTILMEEAKTYIDITDDLTFLPNNKGFIWSSEADNFNHLYYYDNNGKLINQINKGNWDLISFNGNDKKETYEIDKSNNQGKEYFFWIKQNETNVRRARGVTSTVRRSSNNTEVKNSSAATSNTQKRKNANNASRSMMSEILK